MVDAGADGPATNGPAPQGDELATIVKGNAPGDKTFEVRALKGCMACKTWSLSTEFGGLQSLANIECRSQVRAMTTGIWARDQDLEGAVEAQRSKVRSPFPLAMTCCRRAHAMACGRSQRPQPPPRVLQPLCARPASLPAMPWRG